MKKILISFLQKFRQLQGSPVSLARGTAVGVFVGIAPLMPLKSILILLITLATGSSTVAALLVATIIGNPLTYVPLYYLSWLVGNLLLPGRANWETLKAGLDRMQEVGWGEVFSVAGRIGIDTGLVLLTGGLVLALPVALLSYPAALRIFLQIERKRYEKHLLNKKVKESAS
ncbi:MAG: DUF2062 domain-containing protein [Desulfobulbaceae bacterium]|nr:DUF2062 domain-containing protein [Desulfobulbaceae bacterium]